jgi:hypothetical protein
MAGTERMAGWRGICWMDLHHAKAGSDFAFFDQTNLLLLLQIFVHEEVREVNKRNRDKVYSGEKIRKK